MKLKLCYTKRPSQQHWGYDLTVSLSLPADDMRILLRAARAGFQSIRSGCAREGLPEQEPFWRMCEGETWRRYQELEAKIAEAEKKRPEEG